MSKASKIVLIAIAAIALGTILVLTLICFIIGITIIGAMDGEWHYIGESKPIIGSMSIARFPGRTFIVRINKYVPDYIYSLVLSNIKTFAFFSSSIEEVFINNGGTITIY